MECQPVAMGRRILADLLHAAWHEILNPVLLDEDFAADIQIAQAKFDRHHPDAVIGSSRGGAMSRSGDVRLARRLLPLSGRAIFR